ncbi:MAG TPA: hypothetical protein V6C57_10190 [Coleofasciculaceae cyanobacterium]
MKIVYQSLVEQQFDRTAPGIPDWISSVGLEWLYELIVKMEALCKAK